MKNPFWALQSTSPVVKMSHQVINLCERIILPAISINLIEPGEICHYMNTPGTTIDLDPVMTVPDLNM
jgi:hypothetical protein